MVEGAALWGMWSFGLECVWWGSSPRQRIWSCDYIILSLGQFGMQLGKVGKVVAWTARKETW